MKSPVYDHFRWLASIPFDCPLCGTHVPPNVQHECSNGKPTVDVSAVCAPIETPEQGTRVLDSTPGQSIRKSRYRGKKPR